MIAAVTVTTVAAGLALMSVGPMLHSASSRSGTQQLMADLRLTRMKAIAQNRRFRVVFDTSGETYRIEREEGLGNFVADEGPFDLPTAVDISNVDPSDPIFDSRGGVNAATTVTLAAPHGPAHTVTINVLGRVTES
jgi:Tfp pilus assembly protein FimT